ncbi:MAG: hypothetical protein DMF66_10255, partial [Acidobacteria bacterium]
RGRGYDDAAAELEAFGGRQFDPEVVAAFGRVPREEWDEIRRRSQEEGELKAAAGRLERTAGAVLIEAGAAVN